MKIEAPGPTEYGPSFARYVARATDLSDPIEQLTVQHERVVARLSVLDDQQGSARYAPDKWSIKELVNHLSDAERVFAYRLLRIGRGDATPLPGFEENDYAHAARSDRRSFSDVLDEWSAVRRATSALATSLPEADWANMGTSAGGSMSARALLFIILGHTEHHLGVLADRYGIR